MNKNLLILGAGQYGMVAKEIAESMGCFEKIDFLDDNNKIAIDKLADYKAYVSEYSFAIVAIGNPNIRLAVLVSPRAYVAPSAKLMKGAIVEPMAVVNAHAFAGVGVIVCAGAIVNHNAVVEDGCLLQCGSVVTAGALMKTKNMLGYNEVFLKA